jgi:putative membrane protein insertion efficiency factor
MKKILVWFINMYQKNPYRKGPNCKFIPSCSEYTKEAIVKYGPFKGVFIGLKRISRCHPYSKGGYDPLK